MVRSPENNPFMAEPTLEDPPLPANDATPMTAEQNDDVGNEPEKDADSLSGREELSGCNKSALGEKMANSVSESNAEMEKPKDDAQAIDTIDNNEKTPKPDKVDETDKNYADIEGEEENMAANAANVTDASKTKVAAT